MEESEELKLDYVGYFQEIIIQLCWTVDIVHVEILLETSLLKSYLAMSCIGHLEQVLHIFGYLESHPKRKLSFGLAHPDINDNLFKDCDWVEFYQDSSESSPGNKPVPGGYFMLTHRFVDANYAGDTETRWSLTGILLFYKKLPIIWFRKRQNLVEVSTFGFDPIVIDNRVNIIKYLCYKLRMFGFPIDGPMNIFYDNGAVCAITTLTE